MWPFWLGGLALAVVPLAYLGLARRSLGVSGFYSQLVDAVMPQPKRDPVDPELLRAMVEATIEEFGAEAVEAASTASQPSRRWVDAAVFLGCLLLGGVLSAATMQPGAGVAAGTLPRWPSLVLGGTLVGWGTRMAAGCTSGHGLVGLSRFERGSIVATFCFFGAGVVTAWILRSLS